MEKALIIPRETSYVVLGPDADTTDELAAQAAHLIADAGLPVMQLLTSVSRYRDGRKRYDVQAYDMDPNRNVLDVVSAHGQGETREAVLANFSAKLQTWAKEYGLLNRAA